MNRSKLTEKEACDETLRKLTTHRMGLQVRRYMDSKISKESVVWGIEEELGPVLRELAIQKEGEVVEGKSMKDHIHMLISIPPKHTAAQVVGYIKGKSAIWAARTLGRSRNFMGQNFWARGYCVSTTGPDEETIREYIRAQEKADKELD